MKKKVFSLMMTLLLAFIGVAKAEVLTVHDGTATNSYVPFYGLWVDDYTRSEMIYPAAELVAMSGADINSLTFYKSGSSTTSSWGVANFQVYLKEVPNTTLSAYIGMTDATIVYDGAVNAAGGEIQVTINFTAPYHYNGGNLLVGIYETYTGSYSSAYWYGESVTGASASGYNSSSPASASFNQRDFLPKASFDYTPGGGTVEGDLTVYEGTATNQYIPVYGYYADDDLCSQYIIPAADLSSMVGAEISSLTYVLATPAAEAWNATFTVYMTEVNYTEMTELVNASQCTSVYTGTLDATGSTMTVTFDTPYTYNGGNLLIGFDLPEGDNYSRAYFQGVSTDYTAGLCGYSWGSLGYGENFDYDLQFIPTTTFHYTISGEGPDYEVINAIEIEGFEMPAWGVTPEDHTYVAEDANYTLEESHWYTYNPSRGETKAQGRLIEPDPNFTEDGVAYYMSFYVTANEGYGFTDNTVAYLNGDASLWDENYGYIDDYEAVLLTRDFFPADAYEAGLHTYAMYGVGENAYENIDRLLIERPNGAWMEPYHFQLYNDGANDVEVVLIDFLHNNGYFSMAEGTEYPFDVTATGRPGVDLYINTNIDWTDTEEINSLLAVNTSERSTHLYPIIAAPYTPYCPDVVETAYRINGISGGMEWSMWTADMWNQMNPNVPYELHDNYTLPFPEIPEGYDAVMTFTLNHDMMLNAAVTDGECDGALNGKVALYRKIGDEPVHPMADNYYDGRPFHNNGGAPVAYSSIDFETGNFSQFNSYNNTSAYPWTVSTEAAHGGTYGMMSGNRGISSSTSTFSATVNYTTDGTVSFDYNARGEGTSSIWDKCIFKIDGTEQFRQGAVNAWNTFNGNVTAGEHTFTWIYEKDSSVNPTGDAFYVDNIVFDGGRMVAGSNVVDVNARYMAGRSVSAAVTPMVSTTPAIANYEPLRGNATVILTTDDVWGDGSGYQMLLDADATAYGTIIPETGPLTTSGDASAATYSEFEYKIPVNADGSLTTTNMVINNSVSIQIPAGTYDWCITNPTPGDRMWIASQGGTIGGRYDDYVFEEGMIYEFHVYFGGSNDATDLTITEDPYAPVDPDQPVEHTYSAGPEIQGLNLLAGTYYLVASSTCENFEVSINFEELPCPIEAVTGIYPADNDHDIPSDDLTLRWTLNDYANEWRLIFSSTYWPEDEIPTNHPATYVTEWSSDLAESLRITDYVNLWNNTNYFWRIEQRSNPGTQWECVTSGPVFGFTTSLNAPTDLQASNTRIFEYEETVTLSWRPIQDRTYRRYRIYMDGELIYQTPNNQVVTSWDIPQDLLTYNMYNDHGYIFEVSAVYDEGESPKSNIAEIWVSGNGTVSGTVYEQDETTPIGGVTVTLTGTNEFGQTETYVATTEPDGTYEIDVHAGTYGYAVATMEGYQNAETVHPLPFDVVYDEETPNVDFIMDELFIAPAHVCAKTSYVPTADGDTLVQVWWDFNFFTTLTEDFEDFANTDFDWQNDATYPWTLTTDAHEGTYAFKSGNAGVHSSTSTLEVTVDIPQDGQFSFDLWARGESTTDSYDWDVCRFFFDGQQMFQYGQHANWETYTMPITAGSHTFRWVYKKDASVHPSAGDCFIIDNITFVGHADERGDRSLHHYNIYRTDCYNDGPYNSDNTTFLASAWRPDTSYFDVQWPEVPVGVYKWGVSAVYAGNYDGNPNNPRIDYPFEERESEIVWSNQCNCGQGCIDKDMYLDSLVTVNVVLNSADSPEGVHVDFFNLNEGEQFNHPQEGIILDQTGYYVFPRFRKGDYMVTVSLPGYYTIEVEESIWEPRDLRYVLIEIICKVQNLYVSRTGWAMWDPQQPCPEFVNPDDPTGGNTYTYNFEGDFQGWTNIINGEGIGWHLATDIYTGVEGYGANGSDDFMMGSSYVNFGSYPSYDCDDYLVSPQAYAISNGASLSFYHDVYSTSYPDYMEVCVSTAATPTIASFTSIWNNGGDRRANANANRDNNLNFSNRMGNWTLQTLDLSAYAGQNIWIAFHHEAYDQWAVMLDDVTINTGASRAVAQERHLEGYKVMCTSIDGAPIFNHNTPADQPFCQVATDELVEGDHYIVKVAAIYSTGMSEYEEAEWQYESCEHYAGSVDGLTAEGSTVSWTYPGGGVEPIDPDPQPGQNATVVLSTPTDIWGDGSGYQMFLDADHTVAASLPTGNFGGSIPAETIAEFEYSIPANADGNISGSNVISAGGTNSGSVVVPAGTFDILVVNPDGSNVWVVGTGGQYTGVMDDMALEANKTYTFTIVGSTAGDGLNLVVTDSRGNVVASTNIGHSIIGNDYRRAEGADAPNRFSNGNRDVIFSDDFEASFAAQEILNWTLLTGPGCSDPTYNWYIRPEALTTMGHNNSQGFVTSASYMGAPITPDNYLVSPQVALGGTLTFWACAQDPSYPSEHFGVAVSTTGNTNTTDFTMVQEWTLTARTTGRISNEGRDGVTREGAWIQYTVDLSAYAGQMGYFAIRHFNCNDQFRINIDDVELTGNAAPTPTPAEGILGAMVFVDGEWEAFVEYPTNSYTYEGDGQEVCVRIVYDGTAQLPENNFYYAMSCEECIGGLEPVCEPGAPIYAEVTADDQVRIYWDNEPGPQPEGDTFVYDFENSSLDGLTTIDNDGDGNNWVLGSAIGGVYLVDGASLAGSGHNASNDLVCSGSFSNASGLALTPDNFLVFPQSTIAAGSTFSFWACGQDASWVAEHFGVAVSTTGNTSAADFTTIAEWTMTAKAAKAANAVRDGRAQGSWHQYTVDLSDYAGMDVYIAIRHFNCTDQFILDVDDVELSIAAKGNRDGIIGYNIYRSTDNIEYVLIGTVDGNATEYFDAPGTGTFYYQVTALYDGCESEPAVSGEDPTVNYVVVGRTGVGENSANVNLFPNPTKGNVTIQAMNMHRITVVSTLGQVVFDTELDQDEYVLNMAQFNTGLYMVRVYTDEGVTVKRVTVLH